jgi:hypothetical protein
MERIPWLVAMMALETVPFLPTVILPYSPNCSSLSKDTTTKIPIKKMAVGPGKLVW